MKIKYPIGSVSSGTMRTEDLIPTFVVELMFQSTRRDSGVSDRESHRGLAMRVGRAIREDGYYDTDASNSDLESLFDALDCYSAPYCYFGSHPGDGADYGWWPSGGVQ